MQLWSGERTIQRGWVNGKGVRLLVFLFPQTFFDLVLHIGLGIIEFTDTLAESAHEFGDLTAAEENENGQYDEDPLGATRHRDQEY